MVKLIVNDDKTGKVWQILQYSPLWLPEMGGDAHYILHSCYSKFNLTLLNPEFEHNIENYCIHWHDNCLCRHQFKK